MKGKIAIEPNLTPIKDYLTGKGYKVESVDFSDKTAKAWNNYDTFIVSGLNTNFLGIETMESKATVINADGLTPEDVAGRLSALDSGSWI